MSRTLDSLNEAMEYHSYKRLLAQVQKILVRGRKRVAREKLRTYWQIGLLLYKAILLNRSRAGYGSRVIEKLAVDLKLKKTHLYYSLEFYRSYKIFPPVGKLGWSHYRMLLSINNPKKRARIEARAQRQNWSRRKLERVIKQEKLIPKPGKKLVPRKGKIGVYRTLDWEGSRVRDLGFSVYIKAPKARRSKQPKPSELYTYAAQLERVIDGDTIWARVHLSGKIWTRQKLRLREIDAPELRTSAGKKAKRYLQQVLTQNAKSETRNGAWLVITTSKSEDKYGRYLIDLYCGGLYVNQELVDQGHAKIV